jgi:predicted methyltransferase
VDPAVRLATALELVAAGDRSEDDRAKDAGRKPAELLAFAGVSPGMSVADLGAGAGYTTELLARAVGPTGVVYAQNTPAVIEKYVKESWPARLAKPVNARVKRIDSEIGDPLPGVSGLDVITVVYWYHDWLYAEVDRAAVNARLFEALVPGGSLVIVDHRALPGSGEEAGNTVHRIDEALLRGELLAAGFLLAAEGDFMANPEDPRTEAFFRMEGPTDTFVHRYVKPAGEDS